jgi:hypothetical protein
MKFDSPLFDRLRVRPDQDRRPQHGPNCEWPGCKDEASHRAPKGRDHEREYWRFCLAHVREYNQSYNYFAGMSADDVMKYQKDAVTGHRPTWKMGHGGSGAATGRSGPARFRDAGGAHDPFGLFGDEFSRSRRTTAEPPAEARPVRNAERKALDVLGLESGATIREVKTRFKDLVKRHHPDANGGDRSSEDRLRETIQAYNYLKSVGFR